MMEKLIRCIECNEVMNMTEWDFSPEYVWSHGEVKEIKMNDRKAFLQKHKGHEIEELTPITPPISDKPYAEPVKTSYFEASNGNERFLIKRWKNKIDSPFSYEIISGRIEIKNKRVQVQTNAIKKQMKMEKILPDSEEKLNYFIEAVQKEAEELNPEELEISAEGDTPLISYCKLNDDCVYRILRRCQDEFDLQQLKQLKDFILQHNEYDDVMTLIVEKTFSIKGCEEEQYKRPSSQRAIL